MSDLLLCRFNEQFIQATLLEKIDLFACLWYLFPGATHILKELAVSLTGSNMLPSRRRLPWSTTANVLIINVYCSGGSAY